ncbi:MAG: TonB-dependent receptor [Acidobacteriota bacterium]
MFRSSTAQAVVSLLFALLTPALLAVPASAAEVEGRVETSGGVAIEHAEVERLDNGESSYTDPRGRFAAPDCALPCRLLVTHPRFNEQVVEVRETPTGPLTVTLEAKQAVFERIDVTASRSAGETFIAETVATTEIKPEEKAAAPTTLTELVEGVAGVAENGQPGLFQTYAIRGVSRQRILTLVSGMQIVGERRAGVSTSFVDPLLMGAVDVLRGPASTYYGSGALGGVVQIFPRDVEGFEVRLGWEEFADETYQSLAWGGDEGWSIGVVRREASDDEVADGSPQNTGFEQISASIQKSWDRDGRTWELLIIPSRGDDIGKPNTDFPDSRITDYPDEEHLLVKLGLASEQGWSAFVWMHDNSLDTETLRPGSRLNFVANQATDLGANAQREWDLGGGKVGRLGFDYYGRRDVTAVETETRFDSGETTTLRTLDGARQDDVSVYGSLRGSLGAAILQGGIRATWQEQANEGFEARDDTAWSGFLGLIRPLGGGVELTANVGTGLRFPNLSERFFSGTTARGGVIGNPDLDPERSLNLDLGVRWFGDSTFLQVSVFRQEIDDYIERVEISDDLLTFVNLTSGTIEGVELEGFHQLDEAWRLEWSGHLLDGESDDGAPLSDISPDRLSIGLAYENGLWAARTRWQYRAEKNDPGDGEVAIDSANLLSASIAYQVTSELELVLRGKNLLDEEYRSSADDKTSIAPGRSIGVGLTWRRP